MRHTARAFIVILGSAAAAAAQEDYRHGRIRDVEATVSLQREAEPGAEEAFPNSPFLPGDRVWTDARGRAEFQFPDGAILRLDSRGKLDYLTHDARGEKVALKLWSGGLYLRTLGDRGGAAIEIETPAGFVEAFDRGTYRIDVDAGETRLSVYEGEAVLDGGGRRVAVDAGERSYVRRGEEPERPQSFDRREEDEFAAWDRGRQSRETFVDGGRRYLPEELDAYSGELESNGAWRYEASVGYVWQPYVDVGWRPYTRGRWSWTVVRLDLGAERALGLGALPLRSLGPVGLSSAGTGFPDAPGVRPGSPGPVAATTSAGARSVTATGRCTAGAEPAAWPCRAEPAPGASCAAATWAPAISRAGASTAGSRIFSRCGSWSRRGPARAATCASSAWRTPAGPRAVPRGARIGPTPGDTVPELRVDPMTLPPPAWLRGRATTNATGRQPAAPSGGARGRPAIGAQSGAGAGHRRSLAAASARSRAGACRRRVRRCGGPSRDRPIRRGAAPTDRERRPRRPGPLLPAFERAPGALASRAALPRRHPPPRLRARRRRPRQDEERARPRSDASESRGDRGDSGARATTKRAARGANAARPRRAEAERALPTGPADRAHGARRPAAPEAGSGQPEEVACPERPLRAV